MWTVLQDHAVWTAIGCLITIALVWLVTWLIKDFRRQITVDRFDPQEVLGDFAEMKRHGDISPEEYRSIEAAVGNQQVPKQDQADQTD